MRAICYAVNGMLFTKPLTNTCSKALFHYVIFTALFFALGVISTQAIWTTHLTAVELLHSPPPALYYYNLHLNTTDTSSSVSTSPSKTKSTKHKPLPHLPPLRKKQTSKQTNEKPSQKYSNLKQSTTILNLAKVSTLPLLQVASSHEETCLRKNHVFLTPKKSAQSDKLWIAQRKSVLSYGIYQTMHH